MTNEIELDEAATIIVDFYVGVIRKDPILGNAAFLTSLGVEGLPLLDDFTAYVIGHFNDEDPSSLREYVEKCLAKAMKRGHCQARSLHDLSTGKRLVAIVGSDGLKIRIIQQLLDESKGEGK